MSDTCEICLTVCGGTLKLHVLSELFGELLIGRLVATGSWRSTRWETPVLT